MGAIARSDVELVEASRRGEHQAFGQLVARYQDVVCAVSYSSTGDPGLSEDVAQETFIAAWRQLDRLRDTARLRPWLCGIARNLARNARKRFRREEPVDIDEHVAPDASPFEATARGEAERVVREALARVPAAYREVLVLYYREGQSIREVAAALGMTEAAAMQRLSRARRYLADSVHALVVRSLQDPPRRRDMVAAVLAAIVAMTVAPRVDASTTKGSTMLKLALAASAVAAVGATAYLVSARSDAPAPTPAKPATSALHYGGQAGFVHAPSLGPIAASHAPSRSVAEADLGVLPADSDVVIGMNVSQLRQSALWQRFVAPKLAAAPAAHEVEAQCGFDPIASVGSISLGLKNVGDHDAMTGVVVVHGLEKAKAMPCFEHHAEAHGGNITRDGDVILLAKHRAAFTFTDATTALLVIGPDANRQGVERIAAGKSALATASVFTESLQYVNTDASLWFMAGESSPLVKHLNTRLANHAPVQLGTTYASIQVTDSLALDAGLRLGNPATVAKLVASVEQYMATPDIRARVAQTFDQLDITADGSDVIVSLAMSGDQIMQLAMAAMMHHASK